MVAKDIISTLPDEILCHILSFLETKQSVATSILSKRWNQLWRSVTTLYFDTGFTDENSSSRFDEFVYSILVSRNVKSPIKTFHLQVSYDSPLHCPISIVKWVQCVVQCEVKYLNLYVFMGRDYLPTLPIRILSCKTLVFLELGEFGLKWDSSSVILPSLKTLHLVHIVFRKLQEFLLFLSCCPILENLLTRDLEFVSDESLTCNKWKSFWLTNLTTADIDWPYYCFPLKVIHNVWSLSFGIHEVLYNDLIPTFYNLTQLELMCEDITWQFLVEVLNHCPKLQTLDLDQGKVDEETWIRDFDKENWVDPYVVPQCFSSHLRTCNLLQFYGEPGEVILAKYILKNAKVLQNMIIRNSTKVDIKKMLSAYPRASSMCKLTVHERKSSEDNEEIDALSIARV